MDEKIEEMAKLIKPIVVSSYLVDRGNDEVKQKAIEEVKNQQTRNATALYNAGYRKESDTAKEILAELKPIIISYLEEYMVNGSEEAAKYFENLCKKYGVDLGE